MYSLCWLFMRCLNWRSGGGFNKEGTAIWVRRPRCWGLIGWVLTKRRWIVEVYLVVKGNCSRVIFIYIFIRWRWRCIFLILARLHIFKILSVAIFRCLFILLIPITSSYFFIFSLKGYFLLWNSIIDISVFSYSYLIIERYWLVKFIRRIFILLLIHVFSLFSFTLFAVTQTINLRKLLFFRLFEIWLLT